MVEDLRCYSQLRSLARCNSMNANLKPLSSSIEVLLRFYAAEERFIASDGEDFSAITATTHPDILVVTPSSLPYGGEWRGHAEFAAFLRRFAATWTELEVRKPTFVDTATDRIVVLCTMAATARATGSRIEMPICQVNRFLDGMLSEIRPFYWDTAAAVGALENG